MNFVRSELVNYLRKEDGAALPMVILMTVLLGTACISLLYAAGVTARNSSDVLSETKAYYAAESGIQAAVYALRFKNADGSLGGPMDYKAAVNNFANSSDMSTWVIPSDCDPTGGVDFRVRISGACDNAYSLHVKDPDNSQAALAYRTGGARFRAITGTNTFGPWESTRQFTGGPNGGITTIEWVTNSPNPSSLTFSEGTPTVNTTIGRFRISNAGPGGAAFTNATEFEVFYALEIPGNPGWLIKGEIATTGAIKLTSAKYVITGSEIQLCGNNVNGCTMAADLPPIGNGLAEDFFAVPAVITPKEPHRLLVTSVGYGPNQARKKLEAIVQKSPLDGMNSVSPFTMLGPCSEAGNPTNVAVFDAGDGATTTYSGSSAGGVNIPAFAFNHQCNLDTANTYIAGHLTPNPNANKPPQVSPPPAYFPDAYLPEWQRSPQQMESKVSEYREEAQSSASYYNPNITPPGMPNKITNPGWTAGNTGPLTGVTFCEGDCTVDGNKGGGILVVTGKLTSLGGFGFKGLIIVTGPAGWERAGGGCGEITGNVVISPYTAQDLITDVFRLPPKYLITGGGCSEVSYANLDDLFQGENESYTNVVRGVAEK